MFYGALTDAKIIANPKFKIVGKNITLESKAIDSGTKVTIYVTYPLIISYFIQHCQLNTKHVLKGNQYLIFCRIHAYIHRLYIRHVSIKAI
jgi:hypothetical protein